MKTRILATACTVAAVLFVGTLVAEPQAEVDFETITCPVSGKPVNVEQTLDYKEGQVYLCCPGCVAPFEKKTAKYATAANHQLATTQQVVQVNCPISGRAVNEEVSSEVGGITVGYCCKGCLKKVNSAEGDDQLALVFGEEAFEQGFAFPEEEDAE